MEIKDKLACLAFASTERVFANVYSDDRSEEIFGLMDTPENLLAEVKKIGQEYGLNHCGSSFQEEGHFQWMQAVNDIENLVRCVDKTERKIIND